MSASLTVSRAIAAVYNDVRATIPAPAIPWEAWETTAANLSDAALTVARRQAIEERTAAEGTARAANDKLSAAHRAAVAALAAYETAQREALAATYEAGARADFCCVLADEDRRRRDAIRARLAHLAA
jgi:hypothetical protein